MLKTALSILLLVLPWTFAHAQTPANPVVDSLQSELARLEKEVAYLKAESQELRGMLAAAPVKPAKAVKKVQSADTVQTSPGADTGLWLSKSNKRHNKNCRYYKSASGKFCGSKEGVACRVCGG